MRTSILAERSAPYLPGRKSEIDVTVRDLSQNTAYANLERAKLALDSAATAIHQFRLRSTSNGYLKSGISRAEYDRDLASHQASLDAAQREFNIAIQVYSEDVKQHNGHSGLVQQGTLFNGVRK
jgi:hypothetical protein